MAFIYIEGTQGNAGKWIICTPEEQSAYIRKRELPAWYPQPSQEGSTTGALPCRPDAGASVAGRQDRTPKRWRG